MCVALSSEEKVNSSPGNRCEHMIADRHYSRFTNRYGEEWEFEYDPLKE
jgi:hypothetical protein